MTTFHNFALKIETDCAQRVGKNISETRNANNVSMYVWFIHSRIKIFGKIQHKRRIIVNMQMSQ